MVLLLAHSEVFSILETFVFIELMENFLNQ